MSHNGAERTAKRWLRTAGRPRIRGLEWKDGYRGLLDTEAGRADVLLNGDWVRMRAWVNGVRNAEEALSRNADLPANVRYAGVAPRCTLLADAWAEAPDFRRGVREMRGAIRSLGAGPSRARRHRRGDAGPLGSVLAALADEPGLDLVELDGQWEVGVRYSGGRVPVRLTPERGGLRVQRTVVEAPGSDPSRAAVHHMALRLNGDARFARLAAWERGVVAQARLSRPALQTPRIVETARAVAVVSVESGPLLRVLSRPDVAQCYAEMFHP